MMTQQHILIRDILNWLARLPFLSTDDLALLTGQPSLDIEGALHEMDREGYVDWVNPSSPELDTARLYVLTEPVRQHVAKESHSIDERKSVLPVTRGDVVHRLARLEATVALNAFIANLVTLQRRATDVMLQDIWSVLVRRPNEAWWPPGVEAFGCFGSGRRIAPFFIVVDRLGTPAAHRAALIASWYRFRGRQRCGPETAPTIVVLCPDSERAAEWSRQVQVAAERRGVPAVHLVLVECANIANAPNAAGRLSTGGSTSNALAEQLAWWPSRTPGGAALTLGAPPHVRHPASRSRLHTWAWTKVIAGPATSDREWLAALAITTGSVEKRILDCVGRHPLLSTSEMAIVLGVTPHIAWRAVEHALRNELITSMSGEGDSARFCLAALGARVLATRDGVPSRRYLQHAPLTAMPQGTRGGVPALVSQRAHTVGANSFFVSMLTRTTEHCRLVRWEGATEAVAMFSIGGERRTVRPDGAGVVAMEDRAFRFFLEWDRGTERMAILLEKFARYATYYRVQPSSGPVPPTLLMACPSPQREEVIWRAAATVFANEMSCCHLFTTTHPHLDVHGPFGKVWRGLGHRDRVRWPEGL